MNPLPGRLTLITTTDRAGLSRYSSLYASLPLGNGEDLRVICVLQGVTQDDAQELVRSHPGVEYLATTSRVPLSVARNIALEHLSASDTSSAQSFVMFPDDDAWFFPKSLNTIGELMRSGADMIVASFGETWGKSARRSFRGADAALTPQLAMLHANSNSMLIRSGFIPRIGAFDERLGVGTEARAGEEVDYLVRGLQVDGCTALITERQVIGHPDKPHRKSHYYPGSVAVLAKHARKFPPFQRMLIRRLASGLRSVLSRELPVDTYIRGIKSLRYITKGS